MVLDRILGPLHHFLEVVAHDQSELPDDYHNEEDRGSSLEEEDLSVEFDQPDPARPVKCPPCIKHADTTASTKDLRLDFAGKGPVEGDDGLILLGQHRSLHTREGDLGWDDNQNESADRDDEYAEQLNEGDLLSGLDIATIGLHVVKLVQDRHVKHNGNIQSSLLSDSEDCGRDDDVLSCGGGGEAAVPGLGGGIANDDVSPSHLDAAESHGGDDRDERTDQASSRAGSEESDNGAVDGVVNQSDMKTTKAGEGASDMAKVLDRCAELGCNRGLLDEEEVRLHGLELCLLIFLILREKRSVHFGGVFISRGGLKGCGGRRFDHSEGCDDIAVGVLDLRW